MGKAARARRKKARDAKKNQIKAANRARYESLAGTDANRKKKSGSAKARTTFRLQRKRNRSKRLDWTIEARDSGPTNRGYGYEHGARLVKVKRTWKQTHNTVSMKQYLKMIA